MPACTFLFVSTAEVYGLAFNDGRVNEAAPPRPQSSYAKSKAAAEAMLQDVLPAEARLRVMRPSNHTGPGQSHDYVIPSFAAQIVAVERGLQATVRVGNLAAERDIMDVTDAVAAYIAVLRANERLPQRCTFNVASGKSVPIRHLLNALVELSNASIQIEADPLRARPSEVPRMLIDPSALRMATNWRPVVPIETTLLSVLDYERAREPARENSVFSN